MTVKRWTSSGAGQSNQSNQPNQPVDRATTLANATSTSGTAGTTGKIPTTNGTTGQSNETKGDKPLLPHQWRVPYKLHPAAELVGSRETPNNGIDKRTTVSNTDRVIFLQNGLQIMPVVTEEQTHIGHVLLYERTQDSTVYWELGFVDRESMKGEVRLCLSPFNIGSVVLLRRQENTSSSVLSSKITFPDIQAAKKFSFELKNYLPRPANKQVVHDPMSRADKDVGVGALVDVHDNLSAAKPSDESQPQSHYHDLRELECHVAPPFSPEIIEAIPLGINLSQHSLRILFALKDDDYNRMITACSSPEGRNTSASSKDEALQVALSRLEGDRHFRALGPHEQGKILAVVYANIFHGNARVIRQADRMIKLRSSAGPRPGEIDVYRQYIGRLTTEKPKATTQEQRLVEDKKRVQEQRLVEEKRHLQEQRLAEEKKRAEEEETARTKAIVKGYLDMIFDAETDDDMDDSATISSITERFAQLNLANSRRR